MKSLFVTILTIITLSCERQNLDKSIDRMACSNNFSGNILIAIDDSIIINKSYGYSDKNKEFRNNPSTVFPIASITKLFIKQTVLLMAHNKHLSLNDTLSQYCNFINFAEKITISDLIYHKSGIPDIHNRIERFNQPDELKDSVSLFQLFELINSFKQLEFEPGSQVSYSNSNYLILAYIIEKLTNKPLDIYLNETIFRPYGMLQTGLYKYYSTDYGHTSGFFYRNNQINFMPDFNFKNFWGSGNAYSTTLDLFNYYKNTNEQLIPEISSQLVEHSGYYLGFRTFYKVIPEIGLAIIILSNNGDFNINLIVDKTIEYVKEHYLEKKYQNQKDFRFFVGNYSTYRNGNKITVEISENHNELRINNTRLYQIASNKFLLDNNSLTIIFFRIIKKDVELFMNDNGETIVFKRNE